MKKKKSKKKWLFIGGGIIVVVVLIVLNMRGSQRGVVEVQTTKVERGDIISVVSGSGIVEPITSVKITSEVTAEVISIPVREGDYVSRGQVLIRLDTVQAQMDMESALYSTNELMARLDGTEVTLEKYKEDYERQTSLYNKNLTSEQIYKDAYYAYKQQEANFKALTEQVRAAKSMLEKARDNLSKTTINAPVEGTVTLVDVEAGEIAQAQTAFTQGRTLMVISDMSEFEVNVEIDETDIAYLEFGQEADVEIDAFPDTVFEGRVAEIGNTAITSGYGGSDQSTNFRVKVTLVDAYGKIRPGMSSTVDITTNEHADVVTVPIQAVVIREFDPDEDKTSDADSPVAAETSDDEDGDDGDIVNVAVASTLPESDEDQPAKDTKKVEKKGVFVVRDGSAYFVEVEIGINDQQNYEILSGLEVDDEIVTGSFRTLRTLEDEASIEVNNSRLNREEE